MRLLQIDDLDLQSLNLHSLPLVTSDSVSMAFAARRREGELGSMFVSGSPEPSQWVVLFKPDDHEARDVLMAALVSDMTSERRLLARRLDTAQTRVTAMASVVSIEEHNELDFSVALEGSDSVWRSESETETGKTFDSAADLAMHVAVPGNARAYPVLRITPEAQRTSDSIYAGWRWRRRYRIQNNGDVPWFRHPVRIALGDTTGLTPAKAQADGDDVRVWLHGIEQPRTLVAWDSAASFVWVLVPNLPEGESLDFDVVYGNPSATSPPLLAYPDVPAFDLAASANDALVWRSDPDDVADVGEGLYFLSSPTAPFSADYGTPGSWRPVVTLQDADDPDQSGVTYAPFRAQQGDNVWAALSIIRTAADVELFEQIQWRINGFDGIAFSWPLPIEAVTGTVAVDDAPAPGEASAVLLCRDGSADEWTIANEADAGIDLALSSFDLARPMRHVALALWPFPATSRTKLDPAAFVDAGDYITALLTTDLTLEIDDSDLSVAWLGNLEEEIYELAGEARVGGGADRHAPYHAVLLGNARRETGAGTPRLAVKLGNTLAVDCETHQHIEYTASGAFVTRASAHAIHGVQAWDLDGVAQEVGAIEWLPLGPGKTVVPNGDFATGVAGWESDGADTGITVARTWDGATVVGEALGALSMEITASSGAADATARTLGGKLFSVSSETVNVAATVRSDDANLSPQLAVRFYDASETLVATEVGALNYGVVNDPFRTALNAPVPLNATHFRIGLWVRDQVGSTTGEIFFDDVTVNDADVIFTDEEIGEVAVEVGVKGAWLQ